MLHQRALESGVDGIDLYCGLSPLLRTPAHRWDVDGIVAAAVECVELVHAAGRSVRFGCEDAFRDEAGRVHFTKGGRCG